MTPLFQRRAAVGLSFEQKGSGAIIFAGDIAVKASSVDRAFSMGKLCKRLGEFVPGDYPKEKARIEPEPVSPINLKQWRQYQAERAQAHPTSPVVENHEALAQMKRRHQEHRTKLHTMMGRPHRCILNIARHLLKLQQLEEIRRLRRTMGKRSLRPGRQRFENWLRDRGRDYQADRWRYRKNLEALPQEFRGAPSVMVVPKREPLASYARHKSTNAENAQEVVPVAIRLLPFSPLSYIVSSEPQ
jgi:hypothetical protein